MEHTDARNRDLERFLEASCGCEALERSTPAALACDDAALMLSQPEMDAAVPADRARSV